MTCHRPGIRSLLIGLTCLTVGGPGAAWADTKSSQSDERGALPTLAAATRDLPGGSYLGPDGFQEMRGYPTLVGRTAAAGDPELARRLWEESARLTGIEFPAPAPA